MIVCFRFIGDVLVTTPLVTSIKQSVPGATIDYLVFEGTEGVLSHNPHIRNIIAVPRKGNNADVLFSLLRRYDLAFAAYPSDRTLLAAAVAGKRRIGLIYSGKDAWWKKIILSAYHFCDDHVHVVTNILSLLGPLGIASIPRVAMGYNQSDMAFAGEIIPANKYVILHPYSRNSCKYWPAEKWGRLAGLIQEQTDCRAVFTTTPDHEDMSYLREILATAPHDVLTFKKSCTLAQLAGIIKGSKAFVGIDTVVTHMAAALEIPIIALFGPSLTRYWGPWPNGCVEVSPFAANKGVQRTGSVTIIQKDWPCVPCNRETCSISKRGKMECLEELTPDEVFIELNKSLGARG